MTLRGRVSSWKEGNSRGSQDTLEGTNTGGRAKGEGEEKGEQRREMERGWEGKGEKDEKEGVKKIQKINDRLFNTYIIQCVCVHHTSPRRLDQLS